MTELYPDTIAGIKLSADGKKEMKSAIFITDLDDAKVIEHPVRMAIITLLSRGIPDTITTKSVDPLSKVTTVTETPTKRFSLSVIEIVKLSKFHDDIEDLTRNQVNHHLPKLLKRKFVHRYGTVTTGKRITHYYRRTAIHFVVTMATPYYDEKWLERRESERMERTLAAFNISLSNKEKKDLAFLLTKSELLKDKWRVKIADLARGDVTEPNLTDMYHWLIDAYAMGSKEYLDIHQKIRDILFKE
ncbi:MAG: hypothetical protein ACTSSE_07365 [Candidatus Thorarchaeota archaeon]